MEILLMIVQVIASIGIPVAAGMGMKYLNRKWNLNLTEKEQQMLTDAATQAVMLAAQTVRSDNDEQRHDVKLETAALHLQGKALDMGITLSDGAAKEAIEIAVNRRKTQ